MQTHKKLREVLYSIIAVCVIVWAIVYVQVKSTPITENVAPPNADQIKQEQLAKVSKSLTIQQSTTQFKSKLSQISEALNKK